MPSDGMVKLTNEDIKWLIIRVGSGFFTVKKAAQVQGVTERRVQQLVKMHRETGVILRLNPNRRPKTSLEAFLTWYNNRTHGAIDYREGETLRMHSRKERLLKRFSACSLRRTSGMSNVKTANEIIIVLQTDEDFSTTLLVFRKARTVKLHFILAFFLFSGIHII